MQITKPHSPLFSEPCDPFEGLSGYYTPPERLTVHDTEGRLINRLQEGAQLAKDDTLQALVGAVSAWLERDSAMAYALADLTVTGFQSSRRFLELAPTEADLLPLTSSLRGDPDRFDLPIPDIVTGMLNRAYETLWLIIQHRDERNHWMACCSEVDNPFRPVNVPSTRYNQYDITVNVQSNGLAPSRSVRTRFAIFNDNNLPAEVDIPEAVQNRQLPPDATPIISPEDRLLIYIHGDNSRLEEGEKLGEVLNGNPFTIISMDLPCNAYAEMLDHNEFPMPPLPTFGVGIVYPIEFSLLQFLEQFIIDFIGAVGEMVGNSIENQVEGIIGGSLGGNLSLRLAKRRLDDHPWMNNFIAWSAASVWKPKGIIPISLTKDWMEDPETPDRRRVFFDHVFDHGIPPMRPQCEYWYRDEGWEPCKRNYISAGKADRKEIYNEKFRRWHWRASIEQMLFSHREPINLVEKLQGRVLLMTGEGDNYFEIKIYDSTEELATIAINTPGKLRLLKDTGHSIHDERPQQLASEIKNFLPFPSPIDDDSSPEWIGWLSIGENLTSEPVVISNEDDRLEIFVRGENNRIWHATQLNVNGIWEGGLIEMGDGLESEDSLGTFAVERNGDGRLEIFAFYVDEGKVAHAWQNEANGNWNSWNKGLIDKATNGVFAVERSDNNNRLLLAGSISSEGGIKIKGQNSLGGWWSSDRYLGQDSIQFIGVPSAARLLNGHLIIFARDESNRLWRIQENWPDDWALEWHLFSEDPVGSDVSATLDSDGKLTVVTQKEDGQVQFKQELTPNGPWADWETLEAELSSQSKPVLIRNAWGELQLFVRWSDGSIRTKRQKLGLDREWTSWGNLGGNAILGPVVAMQANGMPLVFHIGTDNKLYYSSIRMPITFGLISFIINQIASWMKRLVGYFSTVLRIILKNTINR